MTALAAIEAVPACWGLSDLFDSTDPDVHKTAAQICATCPVIDWCAGQLAEAQRAAHSGGGPQGTWAGRLVGVPKREQRPRTRRSDRIRKSQELDQAIVNRFLAGENLPTTNAEKVTITAHWLAMGRSRRSLERRTGWKLERYMKREEMAS